MDDDESESHAAKLLEIIILQCQQHIDNVLKIIKTEFLAVSNLFHLF